MPDFSGQPRGYGTHLPLLVKCILSTDGPVLELGGGLCSTPTIRALCPERPVLTVESVEWPGGEDWHRALRKLDREGLHETLLVDDWDAMYPRIASQRWSVVLIDHGPESRRHVDILRLKDHADLIVAHDASPDYDGAYHYSRVIPEFKWHAFDHWKPMTLVLSNSLNLFDLWHHEGDFPR